MCSSDALTHRINNQAQFIQGKDRSHSFDSWLLTTFQELMAGVIAGAGRQYYRN
jgi:hypothetical protein